MASFPTPKNPLAGAERSFSVSNLPEKLLRHIERSPARSSWEKACWIWTGYTKPAKRRYKPARPSENPRSGSAGGYFETDKPTPMVRDPYGSSADKLPAHRVIYGFLTCTQVDKVRVLQRCENPRCVSPYHVREIAPARGPRIPPGFPNLELSEAQPPILSEEHWTDEKIMAKLKEIQPWPDVDMMQEECGIPKILITASILAEYSNYFNRDADDD